MAGTPGLSSYPSGPQNADISCANSADISCVNDIKFFNLFDVPVVASGAARARTSGPGECNYKAKLPNPNQLAPAGARQLRTTFLAFHRKFDVLRQLKL